MSCCGGSGRSGCCDPGICEEVKREEDERSESSEDASIDRKDIPS